MGTWRVRRISCLPISQLAKHSTLPHATQEMRGTMTEHEKLKAQAQAQSLGRAYWIWGWLESPKFVLHYGNGMADTRNTYVQNQWVHMWVLNEAGLEFLTCTHLEVWTLFVFYVERINGVDGWTSVTWMDVGDISGISWGDAQDGFDFACKTTGWRVEWINL